MRKEKGIVKRKFNIERPTGCTPARAHKVRMVPADHVCESAASRPAAA